MRNIGRWMLAVVLAVVLVSGCVRAKEPVMRQTVGTLAICETEEPIPPTQMDIGRSIVMVARGWDYWPGYYTADEAYKIPGITAEQLWFELPRKREVQQ